MQYQLLINGAQYSRPTYMSDAEAQCAGRVFLTFADVWAVLIMDSTGSRIVFNYLEH